MGGMGGMGGMEDMGGMGGGADLGGLGAVMNDPEILEALQDPDVQKAFAVRPYNEKSIRGCILGKRHVYPIDSFKVTILLKVISFQDVSTDPSKLAAHQSNPKVRKVMEKLASKFGGAGGPMGGGFPDFSGLFSFSRIF
jgi:hypothetical protein